ncbi:hypothetical protein BDA99DRAFT_603715 [Phascolomyces articulosus]|uniref:Uncharacterized protein n=1 Tax=Phascolomyces articulosus TaxID=60185 RepID=A0AAD5K3W9_9FUNG|nr:hypothetical protein BDA99DRAFT_603715 [Phascolomyces articulosus]
MGDDDLAKRVAQLKEEKEIKETDEELAQRFERVFPSQPITGDSAGPSTQKNKYDIPSDTNMDEVEKMLQEVDLFDSDDDDDGGMLYYYTGSTDDNAEDKKLKKIEQDLKLKELQKTFLGNENDGDIGLDDESHELLKQIKDQVDVEKKYAHLDQQRERDLEQRYLALKQNPPTLTSTNEEDNVATGQSSSSRAPGPPPKPIQEDEFHDEMDDWCIICNEDATIECKGCDHDRFCDRCWFDGHRSDMADYEAMKHQFIRLAK